MLGILALTAAAALPTPPKIDASKPPPCQKISLQTVQRQKEVVARKLNELPNANHYLAVMRVQDGCQRPVIVRYDIGSAPRGR